MNRFVPYLGIAVALLLSIFAAAFFDIQTIPPSPTTNTHSTSATFSSVPSLSPSPARENSATISSPIATSISKKKAATTSPVSTPALSVVKTVSSPTPSPAPVRTTALDSSASALVGALVNIICYVPQGSGLHSISGSGVFIDPKGIILTNAHVAQYFLLAQRGVSCVIRSGTPAVKNYAAALLYISPVWLRENTKVLTEKSPSGTGQYDFALLAVTQSATTAILPASFPFLPLAQTPPQKDTPIVIASYGAQFLDSSQILSALFPTLVFGSVKNVLTFATNTIDVIALGGSAVAQEGSSGGGVAGASGTLVGTITTSSIEGDTTIRSLSAITASYIRAEYATETGKAIDLLLAAPTAVSVADFAPQIPALEAILTANLP